MASIIQRNYIVLFKESMCLSAFKPKVFAALYGKLKFNPKILHSVMINIYKLLYSVVEQGIVRVYCMDVQVQKSWKYNRD